MIKKLKFLEAVFLVETVIKMNLQSFATSIIKI